MSKKKVYLVSVAIIVVVGFVLYAQVIKPKLDNRTIAVAAPVTITSQTFPLEFTYLSGETAYTLIEPPVPTTTSSGLQKVYLIMDNQSYIDFQSDENIETPLTISVFVFQDPELTEIERELSRMDRLRIWAEQHSQYSSFQAKNSEPEIIESDGLKGLRYLTAGDHQQEVRLFNYKGYTYVFTGQFDNESDAIYQMYNEMMQSVVFD